MTFGHFGRWTTNIGLWMLVVTGAAAPAFAQAQPHRESQTQAKTSAVQGHVRDSSGKPVADVSILLQRAANTATTTPEIRTIQSDSEGVFHFSGLREGAYNLRAEVKGRSDGPVILVNVARNETKTVDLVLMPTGSSDALATFPSQSHSPSSSPEKPEFFDEPQFTVAGVTQATTSGGHGSDTVLRNSEALVKATVSLGKESESKELPANKSSLDDSAGKNSTEASRLREERAQLQAQILRDDHEGKSPSESVSADNSRGDRSRETQSDLHHQLAQIEEKLDDPLEAVREYQRASELTPSEPNLFDWASELLAHRALEPATEVFATGNRLYPQSVRMLIGLGVAWYARGSYDHAAQYLGSASDLNPADPTPYLFMGKMQSVETVPSPETLERLARFQRLEPGNALARYYYAVGLWKSKQAAGVLDDASSAQVETLLKEAVQLDPKSGAAELQLGILYAQREDYARAIPAYQKAIEVSPDLEEAHYRLAQAYRRAGNEAKAKEELQLHEQLSKQSKEQAERARREIQQFVISLRDRNSR